MKKLILCASLLMAVTSISLANNNLPAVNESAHFWKKMHVTGTITLSGNCKITYDLLIDISLFPPSYNGISGTLTMSGTCSGTQNINARGTVNGKKKTTDFEITSSPTKINAVLQSQEFRNAMITKLDEANLFSDTISQN